MMSVKDSLIPVEKSSEYIESQIVKSGQVLIDIMAAMHLQVRQHLVECCKELDEYRVSGILRAGKVRELASSIRAVARSNSLQVVISQVSSTAISRVSKLKDKK